MLDNWDKLDDISLEDLMTIHPGTRFPDRRRDRPEHRSEENLGPAPMAPGVGG